MYDQIINAVNTALQSIPNMPTVYTENDKNSGKPALGTDWIRTTIIPSEPVQISRGDDRMLQYTTLFQLDYFRPLNSLSTAVNIDDIIAYFNANANRDLGLPELQAMVLRTWRNPASTEQNWYRVPIMVRVQWFSE